jgi:hypothetical protein
MVAERLRRIERSLERFEQGAHRAPHALRRRANALGMAIAIGEIGPRYHRARRAAAARAARHRARRTPSSQAPRLSPCRTSGCLSSASSGTGAKRSAAASATASNSVPAGVSDSGVPAESSATMLQRAKCAATRRASGRSGVTKAAVRPGVSIAWRSASAIVCASSAGLESSIARMPDSRPLPGLEPLPQMGEFGGLHRMGEREATHRAGIAAAAPAPAPDLVPPNPEPIEQQP